MKVTPVALLFLLLALVLNSQTKVDSLIAQLQTAEGEERIKILNYLATHYLFSKPGEARIYNREAGEMLQNTAYPYGRMKQLNNSAMLAFLELDYSKAEINALEALQISKELDNPFFEGAVCNVLAAVLEKTGQYTRAVKYQNQGVELYKQLRDTVNWTLNLHNLAGIYGAMNHAKKHLEILLEVYEIQKKRNDQKGAALTASNLGSIYFNHEKYDKALQFYTLGFNYYEPQNETYYALSTKHGMAKCLAQLNSPDRALQLFEEVEKEALKENLKDVLSPNYYQKARLYELTGDTERAIAEIKKSIDLEGASDAIKNYVTRLTYLSELLMSNKNYSEALKVLTQALNIAKELDSPFVQVGLHKNLAAVYEKNNDFEKATEHLKQQIVFQDSLDKRTEREKLAQLEIDYEVKEMATKNQWLENENTFNTKKIKLQRIAIGMSILFSAVLILFLVLLFLSGKKIRNANCKLEQQNVLLEQQSAELAEANATKDRFFSIIGHDLKNPFNAILGYLEMLQYDFDNLENNEIRNRIAIVKNASEEAYKLLENLLMWSQNQMNKLKPVIEKINLSEVLEEELRGQKMTADKKQLKIEEQIEDGLFVMADKNMLAFIFRNIISNGIKFTPKQGEIFVAAHWEGRHIRVAIRDTGIGMSAEEQQNLFRIDSNTSRKGTENESGTGLGLVMCQAFATINNAQLHVASETNKGSTFTLLFSPA